MTPERIETNGGNDNPRNPVLGKITPVLLALQILVPHVPQSDIHYVELPVSSASSDNPISCNSNVTPIPIGNHTLGNEGSPEINLDVEIVQWDNEVFLPITAMLWNQSNKDLKLKEAFSLFSDAIHTITGTGVSTDLWIKKDTNPNGVLPQRELLEYAPSLRYIFDNLSDCIKTLGSSVFVEGGSMFGVGNSYRNGPYGAVTDIEILHDSESTSATQHYRPVDQKMIIVLNIDDVEQWIDVAATMAVHGGRYSGSTGNSDANLSAVKDMLAIVLFANYIEAIRDNEVTSELPITNDNGVVLQPTVVQLVMELEQFVEKIRSKYENFDYERLFPRFNTEGRFVGDFHSAIYERGNLNALTYSMLKISNGNELFERFFHTIQRASTGEIQLKDLIQYVLYLSTITANRGIMDQYSENAMVNLLSQKGWNVDELQTKLAELIRLGIITDENNNVLLAEHLKRNSTQNGDGSYLILGIVNSETSGALNKSVVTIVPITIQHNLGTDQIYTNVANGIEITESIYEVNVDGRWINLGELPPYDPYLNTLVINIPDFLNIDGQAKQLPINTPFKTVFTVKQNGSERQYYLMGYVNSNEE